MSDRRQFFKTIAAAADPRWIEYWGRQVRQFSSR